MQDLARIFDGVKDPGTCNASRHDLHEMLIISLRCAICGGRTCADMELFGRSRAEFLRRFMKLEHGVPSRGAFSALFRILDPDCLGRAFLRLAADGPAGCPKTEMSRSPAPGMRRLNGETSHCSVAV